MDRNEIITQLKQIVKPYIDDVGALDHMTEATDFLRDLKMNSANLVDVVLDVEEKFGIVIDNSSMERMLDVRTTVDIIAQKLSEL